MSTWTLQSLRLRIPALIAVLVAGSLAVFGWSAHRSVRESAMEGARVRTRQVAEDLAGLFATSFQSAAVSVAAVASDPAVVGALAAPGRMDTAAVRSALEQLGPPSNAVVGAELRDASGRAVLSLEPGRAPETVTLPPAEAGSTGISLRGDTALHRIYARVADPEGRTLGWVAQLRRLRSSPAETEALSQLIGDDSNLLVGNRDGSVWTDLLRIVERPAPDTAGTRYARDGEAWLADSAPIGESPLVVAIEFPEARVLAPANALVVRFFLLGSMILVAAAAAGLLLTLGITRTLVRVTHASEAMAAGDPGVEEITTDRRDELGRLATAFNAMARAVRATQASLEEQVAERTRELHEAQEELLRKERLATLGQLSGSVGHELRNPLGVMTNAVYYLQTVLASAPPKIGEYLGILKHQILIAEKIVSDLLDFARVKPPQLAVVSLPTLVQEQLGRVVVPPQVTVEADLPETLPAVRVDPLQTGQVLLNLISNGIQAMETGGGTLTLTASVDDGRVSLSVQDTGPGVSPEHRPKIFEPLFTTKARGIGLGLSVSRSLARAGGGDLRLAEDGPGARFVVDLPVAGGE